MTIIKELPLHTLKAFISFLMSKKYDYSSITKLDDLKYTLFYYLEFLNSQNIFILPNDLGYVIFKTENKIQTIIECNFCKYDLLELYHKTIIKSFNYLENPF